MASLRRTLAALVGALAAVMLSATACTGSAGSPPPSATTPAASSGPATQPPASATPDHSPEGTPPPSGSAGQITVRGIVRAGVEAGCLLLEVDFGPPYLLIGGSDGTTLKPGAQVEVVGVPHPGLVTTCQQGTPLQVISAEPL